jgi:uncharacterized protein
LMYWQVYLHKTVLSAENLLVRIIGRARELAESGVELFATPAFREFLYNRHSLAEFENDESILNTFSKLDDFDVFTSVKEWCGHSDKVLSLLCRWLVERNLYRIEITREPASSARVEALREKAAATAGIDPRDSHYLVFTGAVENNAYSSSNEMIYILFKDGTIADIADASDNLNISVLSNPVKKYFLCTGRGLTD